MLLSNDTNIIWFIHGSSVESNMIYRFYLVQRCGHKHKKWITTAGQTDNHAKFYHHHGSFVGNEDKLYRCSKTDQKYAIEKNWFLDLFYVHNLSLEHNVQLYIVTFLSVNKRVLEWLLFDANFTAISRREQATFYEIMMMSTLFYA